MRLLLGILEVFLIVFASWTLAYHFSLLVNLPSGLISVPFLSILILLSGFFQRDLRHAFRFQKGDGWFLLGTISLGFVIGVSTIFISNPNPDDFNFFHRALVQLQHLKDPFILTDTGHNISGLPPLSILHVLTSYEHFVAMAATLVGADPLGFYHNVCACIAEILIVIVYVLLYGHFGLKRSQSLCATMGAVLFFLLDLRLNGRSFGNILLYLWVGKVMMWGILIPITFLEAYRYLCCPTPRRLSFVVMTGISAVGLSGSGVFMIPILIFAVSLAYLFTYGFTLRRLKHTILLNCASCYCVVIALGGIVGLLPKPDDTLVWSQGWPSIWWQNLTLVISHSSILIRDLLILFLLPLIAIARPLNRFLHLLTGTLCLIFANPLFGPFWIQMIQPAAYWRLLFLLPLPWCAGLMLPCIMQVIHLESRGVLFYSSVALVMLSMVNAYLFSGMRVHEISEYLHAKKPLEYRLSAPESAFVRSVGHRLDNRNILAPERVVVVLALINPTTRFEATRGTLHTFGNAGLKEEGLRRVAVQDFVGTCKRLPENHAALRQSFEMGIDAIIISECKDDLQASLFPLSALSDGPWREAARNNGYILYSKE